VDKSESLILMGGDWTETRTFEWCRDIGIWGARRESHVACTVLDIGSVIRTIRETVGIRVGGMLSGRSARDEFSAFSAWDRRNKQM
jgi:hypothetical protein